LEEKTKNMINKKDLMRALRVLLVLLIILGGIGTVRYLRVREYKNYERRSETTQISALSGYKVGEGKLFTYNNDGAKALNGAGETVWEIAYQLDNPELAYCEDVAAVADIGGTGVYVVAANGIPHDYQVIYPIVKHEVSRQGVTAVLLDNGLEDFIQLYDLNGTLRVDINTKTKIDGIPVDIALSPDGKKLVTLYVTFQGDAMLCKATFYNADEVGKNQINNIVGQKTFAENLLAYDVCFLNEDLLCVLLENGFALYGMTEVPELICEVALEEKILDVLCVENGIFLVKETEEQKKVLCFYDEKGKETVVIRNLPEYESVSATSEEVVFFSPQRVNVYRSNGSLKFGTSFAQSLEGVFPAGRNQYFLVDTGTVQTIKLTNSTKNERNEEN